MERRIFKTGWEAMGFKTYQDYLASNLWIEKRDFIIKQREGKCEMCGTKENLIVHHVSYENVCNEKSRDLLVLCFKCHEKVHQK